VKAKTITFEGKEYKLKPKAPDFPREAERLEQLCWLVKWTYPKGFQKARVRIGGCKLRVK
jgi:hypothetical protein